MAHVREAIDRPTVAHVEKAAARPSIVRAGMAIAPRSTDPDLKATARRLTVPAGTVIGPRSTDRDARAIGLRSIVRAGKVIGLRSTDRDARATGLRLTARGVMVGRLLTAPGNQIGRRLTARGVNFVPSLIDLAEILARPRSARDPRSLRAIARGRIARGAKADHPLTEVRRAVRSRTARAGRDRKAVAIGNPGTNGGRPVRTTLAQHGQQASTPPNSWAKTMS